jgi:hypothetical protein
LLRTSSVCGPDKSRNPTGANFVIKRDNGLSVSNGITPAKYTVEFTRKGETQSIPISASINGWYVGNLLFGGLIGFLIVDPATGAMWKLDDAVIANFAQSVTIKNGKKEVQIAHIDEVPLHKRSQLVALN